MAKQYSNGAQQLRVRRNVNPRISSNCGPVFLSIKSINERVYIKHNLNVDREFECDGIWMVRNLCYGQAIDVN